MPKLKLFYHTIVIQKGKMLVKSRFNFSNLELYDHKKKTLNSQKIRLMISIPTKNRQETPENCQV